MGETLPPRAALPLSELGLWERFLAAKPVPCHGISSAWGGDDLNEASHILSPYGNGWHVDRQGFDSMLAGAAVEAGVSLLTSTRITALAFDGRRWNLTLTNESGQTRAQARFLVDATGRTASVGRSQGGRWSAIDRLLGIAAVVDAPINNSPFGEFLLLEAMENGWWYSVPLPGGRALFTLMTDADVLAQDGRPPAEYWLSHLRATRHTKIRAGAMPPPNVHLRTACAGGLDQSAGPGWLAVGDAACAFDPLSSQGITKGLSGGLRAGSCLHAHLEGDADAINQYQRAVTRSNESYRIRHAHFYGLEKRWLESPFWSRRRAIG